MTASRVFCAATLSGALTLSAALDAGLFGDRTQRRLLLVSSNVAVPELVPTLDESAAFAMLRDRFDDVVRWNDIIAPMHPTHWLPPDAEVPMLTRLFTDRLGLRDGVTELVVDSITAAPAAAIALLLRDCPIAVYAEDLSAYGPTERTPRPGIGRRVERLLHLDLVPELAPLLLSEYAVDAVALPDAALTEVAAGADSPDVADGAGAAVIVGQHLEQLGIMTRREQAELHLRMLRALAARGERQIVFCPHPGDVHAPVSPLRALAEELDVELTVAADSLPVDAWLAAARPSLVVSCFATELVAAPRRHGLEVASVGCEDVLERLTPFENSLRIPATIVDATVPRLADDGGITAPPAVDVPRLVSAVAYCMQADRLPALRGAAESHLAEHGRTRYFKRRRLEALGLIAPPPPQPAPAPPPPRTRPGKGLLAGARAAAAKRLPH